ncbi:MAG: NERD domain-containing protein [Bacteroidota bacterium]|nr:MAG: NERD domain-containing protein [Bacteroidota bacterium]
MDHILVSPSGIFLIETKNWSEKSLESLSLRSPVQQIRRTSFVLFKLLNNEMSNYHLRLDRHHWGDKNINQKSYCNDEYKTQRGISIRKNIDFKRASWIYKLFQTDIFN